MRSQLTINEIISAKQPIPDKYFAGANRWNVSGAFRGSKGTWELVLDKQEKIIHHFNFVGKK